VWAEVGDVARATTWVRGAAEGARDRHQAPSYGCRRSGDAQGRTDEGMAGKTNLVVSGDRGAHVGSRRESSGN
jgi:hypothetical protein